MKRNLDASGQCCGRCPIDWFFTNRKPYKYCPRCDRAFNHETGEQIPNWAWGPDKDGNWERKNS